MFTPHLRPLNDHDAAAPPLLVPAFAAPAAVPAAVERLKRAPRQRTLGQQRRRRRVQGVLEAGRQRVRAGLRREVAAGLALRRGPRPFPVLVFGRRGGRALLGGGGVVMVAAAAAAALLVGRGTGFARAGLG